MKKVISFENKVISFENEEVDESKEVFFNLCSWAATEWGCGPFEPSEIFEANQGSGQGYAAVIEALQSNLEAGEGFGTPWIDLGVVEGRPYFRWRGQWTQGRFVELIPTSDGGSVLVLETGTNSPSSFFSRWGLFQDFAPELCLQEEEPE